MSATTRALFLVPLLAGCAVNLGGPKPEEYQTLALAAPAAATPADIARTAQAVDAEIVLLSATQDSAWFAEVAAASGLALSGPARTEPNAKAFYTNLKILGDTSIVLGVADGTRMHVHDALYEISENRLLDLMLVGVPPNSNLRDAVRALLGYIATDVGPNAALIVGIDAPTPAAGDSMAVLLRAAYTSAWECAGPNRSGRGPARVWLFYGPAARMSCRSARTLDGDGSPITALLVVGR
jgi:hypothetical protein